MQRMKKNPSILLTFDVEEFDLPLEYNLQISEEEQMCIGKLGADEMQKIIDGQNIPTTLFTTANFAQHYPELLKTLSQKNEIGSHTYNHSRFAKDDLEKSRIKLAEITGTAIKGLRMPRFKKIDMDWIKEAGYEYDSSINPTYMPGRYNNLKAPRTVFKENDFTRLPVSVSSLLRFPLFWMAFKNLPYPLYKKMALDALQKDGYLSLYFHPWEFTDITKWKIPFYLKKACVNELSDKLNRLIEDLKKEAEFKTVSNFLATYNATSHQ
jgi:peptidoglycan/xylan/chitin deacetylase (PgdA/CDA1 family)